MTKTKRILMVIIFLLTFQTTTSVSASQTYYVSEGLTPSGVPEPTLEITQMPTPTPIPQVKNGLKKENGRYYYYINGEKLTKSWKKINGKKYYFGSKGHASTKDAHIGKYIYVFNTQGQLQQPSRPSFVTVGNNRYYVNKKGIAAIGWFTVGGKLYYANNRGRLTRSATYENIKFNKNGAAKNDTRTQLKMKTMSIVNSITNSKMTKSQKLWACWNYVVGGNIWYYSYYPNIYKEGWEQTTALYTLENGRGNCYGYACAFAALAKEIGYNPYLVCGRVSGNRDGASDGLTRHCWVMISGLYYDPEAQYAGWYSGVYGGGYYDIYHTIQKYEEFD